MMEAFLQKESGQGKRTSSIRYIISNFIYTDLVDLLSGKNLARTEDFYEENDPEYRRMKQNEKQTEKAEEKKSKADQKAKRGKEQASKKGKKKAEEIHTGIERADADQTITGNQAAQEDHMDVDNPQLPGGASGSNKNVTVPNEDQAMDGDRMTAHNSNSLDRDEAMEDVATTDSNGEKLATGDGEGNGDSDGEGNSNFDRSQGTVLPTTL